VLATYVFLRDKHDDLRCEKKRGETKSGRYKSPHKCDGEEKYHEYPGFMLE
jgi:hypothetical protein